MKKSEAAGQDKPVSQPKTEPAKAEAQGPYIYLGPPVRSGALHLEPRQIHKQKPAIPEGFDFLTEFLVPVQGHGALKAGLAAKFPVAAQKVRALAQKA